MWQTVNALEQEFRDRAAQQATQVTRSGVNVTPKPFTFGVGATATSQSSSQAKGVDGSDAAKGDDSRSLEGISEAVRDAYTGVLLLCYVMLRYSGICFGFATKLCYMSVCVSRVNQLYLLHIR